ncbi:MAG TPA: beta-glucosidase BglX [Tenuifilaceae bacterium]|nr:beta-glucosidase BglX [Tenuifilaceae bacterium]
MNKIVTILFLGSFTLLFTQCSTKNGNSGTEKKVDIILSQMSIEEKIGQLVQKNADFNNLEEMVRSGKVGSVINEVNPERILKLQKIAVEESRLGIPLLIGRDVIHGFRTIMPIPLAQAATWNPELVEKGARVAATEAASQGIRWSFAPMIDVTRDPRWGRVAEGFGEDSYLTGQMGAAVVEGFQGENLSNPNSIAACAKHFAAYGWAEGGRDYNSANISENDLYDIILPPFKECIDVGAASIMTAFNDINGIPASGNSALLNDLLRKNWGYNGVVVSDWASVVQMETHGYTPNQKEAAYKSLQASLDMEMVSSAYEDYLIELLEEGRISETQINDAVRRILRMKFDLGLFDKPIFQTNDFPELLNENHLEVARKIAQESVVLLKNSNSILPIKIGTRKITVIGPMADAPHEQLGTWIFDGSKEDAITPLQSLREVSEILGIKTFYHKGLDLSRSKNIEDWNSIQNDVKQSDLVLLFLGEESILSGEAHSRADINLPGAQMELVSKVATLGKPTVATIMAGRPLTFFDIEPMLNAILYAWHPGTMAGPAITDLLTGKVSPSAKLPMTFPKHVGQIPIYYNHKNTGKPASNETWVKIDDIPREAVQYSIGNTSLYLDYGFEPLYPFGFGLSYSTFEVSNIKLEKNKLAVGDSLIISGKIKNTGKYHAAEVVQVYTHQLFGSRTRPVKELKAFSKITLNPDESKDFIFKIGTNDLSFHNPEMKSIVESGKYLLWVGNSSQSGTKIEFEII